MNSPVRASQHAWIHDIFEERRLLEIAASERAEMKARSNIAYHDGVDALWQELMDAVRAAAEEFNRRIVPDEFIGIFIGNDDRFLLKRDGDRGFQFVGVLNRSERHAEINIVAARGITTYNCPIIVVADGGTLKCRFLAKNDEREWPTDGRELAQRLLSGLFRYLVRTWPKEESDT